jgi:F-type H+-transporting ATPase subunit delta
MSRADATVAERYARAIFELALESGDATALAKKFDAFAAVYLKAPELRNALENPQVQSAERDAILRAVAGRLGFGTLELNALRYIARRRRLRAVPEIAEGLGRLADERSGIVRATVTAAAPLPEAFYERLKRELESITGKSVSLERQEDKSLIAGVITRIGGRTLDGSLRGRLEQIGQTLQGS